MSNCGEIRFTATILVFANKKLAAKLTGSIWADGYGEAEERFKSKYRKEYPKCGIKVCRVRAAE